MDGPVTLESDALRVVLHPAFGARITELTCLRTGRNWLVPQDAPFGAAEAPYLGGTAKGWDECFPNVGCDGPDDRDHGWIWGRAHDVETIAFSVVTRFEEGGLRMTRRLTIDDCCVSADYEVSLASDSPKPLPWLYSQHCLLACRPGERIVLIGLSDPDPPLPASAADLIVRSADAGIAAKSFARGRGKVSASIQGPDGGLRFDWDADVLPWCGLWIDCGGWPADAPVHQIALEPTTAPADTRVEAGRIGALRHLQPGETHRWRIDVTLIAADLPSPPKGSA